ncbi:MAG: 23S rRNA (uracil(1939)-C(5))-methyltransferase RlmD [Cohnella sp.]|uniref:23S rRNA (uracil(1939)-C(5))-methyltransferase RlmD n=1 Tax=Cohnella sp. TaxID=1883426 RepID=UPI000E373A3F|nr:23S rRNA (uracil(1939)-C(5))-methyltransferase RlmD [Cohnella sp.]REK60588.1 MAG: 23S rRNA (uracil(1939)-C(5))-methyltransferase RlmD [Cohnella sp.]
MRHQQRKRAGRAQERPTGLPVDAGQSIEADVIGLTHDGEGVVRVEGYTLFVRGALPGDRVRADVVSVGKSFGRARMNALVKPSAERIAAPCAIYDACGGCQLQHWDYAAQLRWKRQHVADNLARIGKLPVAPLDEASGGPDKPGTGIARKDAADDVNQTVGTVESGAAGVTAAGSVSGNFSNTQVAANEAERAPADSSRPPVIVHRVIGMPDPWRYRNKAQVPIGGGEGGLIGGFYEQGSHQIVDMDVCLIQQEPNEETVRAVKEIARSLGYSAYNRETGRGLLRHVVVRHAEATGQRMVVLVTNGRDLPHKDELVSLIRRQIPGVASICQNINTERSSVVFGEETRVLWGEEAIYDRIGDIEFAISARSFFQVNPLQTEKLYRTAVEYAALTGEETVIDAYCGIGTITLFLARHARRVYGVEIVPEAIADARRNAALNGIANAEFAVGPAEVVLPRWQAEGIKPDVIVVDPPRKGCDAKLLETILQLRPARVVYVSCNPSTLARDLRVLEGGGYRTVEVQPVDMFPHTMHVECCSLLVRKDN